MTLSRWQVVLGQGTLDTGKDNSELKVTWICGYCHSLNEEINKPNGQGAPRLVNWGEGPETLCMGRDENTKQGKIQNTYTPIKKPPKRDALPTAHLSQYHFFFKAVTSRFQLILNIFLLLSRTAVPGECCQPKYNPQLYSYYSPSYL